MKIQHEAAETAQGERWPWLPDNLSVMPRKEPDAVAHTCNPVLQAWHRRQNQRLTDEVSDQLTWSLQCSRNNRDPPQQGWKTDSQKLSFDLYIHKYVHVLSLSLSLSIPLIIFKIKIYITACISAFQKEMPLYNFQKICIWSTRRNQNSSEGYQRTKKIKIQSTFMGK